MVPIGIAAIALFVAGPLLAMVGIVPALVGFLMYALGGFLGLIAAIGGIVALVRGRGSRVLALGAVPAAVFIASFVTGMGPPPINDISTDLENPPAFVKAQEIGANKLRDFAYREDFKPIVRSAYPDLKPLRVKEAPEAAYDRALALARAQPGWEITHEDRAALTFEGVATSRLFRFHDDFVVRVRPDGDGAAVDMRSKSRDGIGDRGANAARIRAFFAALA